MKYAVLVFLPILIGAQTSLAPQDGTSDREAHLASLTNRWASVARAVMQASVRADGAEFDSSLAYWSSGYLTTGTWSHVADDLESRVKGDTLSVLVTGDAKARISAGNGSVIHIYGDLEHTLTLTGLTEVVIGGNVTEDAEIIAGEITHLFVGGDVKGEIRCSGSARIWVQGSVSGSIHTGEPMTKLQVRGDFTGTIAPVDRPAMLLLDVQGYISLDSLSAVATHDYTMFLASVGRSDQPIGIHTTEQKYNEGWVVHSEHVPGHPTSSE